MTPASALSLFVAYTRERFPIRRYAPLALLIAIAGLAGDASAGPARLAGGFAIAVALLFQLRLWDDIEDLPRDRAEHPGRVLSRAPAPAMGVFRTILASSLAVNAAILAALAPFPGHLAVFLALSAAFWVWYRLARGAVRSAAASSLVVLAKYPAFVYLAGDHPASADAAWHRALAAALVYLAFCAYEVLHDPRVRGERIALPLLGAEMLSMIAISFFMCAAVARRSAALGVGYAAVGIVSALGLGILFLRCRRSGALPSSGQGVFVLCLLQIVSFTVGIRA